MAHSSQFGFAGICVRAALAGGAVAKVLEVGSADINGSVRSLFVGVPDLAYVGADLAPGPGVDVVMSGNELRYPDHNFDLVMSFECFEHNPYWRETCSNMLRMCRPGGVIIVSCAAPGRPEHGTQATSVNDSFSTAVGWNYYRNISQRELLACVGEQADFEYRFCCTNRWSCDLYLVAVKKGGADSADMAARLKAVLEPYRVQLTARATDWPTGILSRVFGGFESIGIPHMPYARHRLVGMLKALKAAVS